MALKVISNAQRRASLARAVTEKCAQFSNVSKECSIKLSQRIFEDTLKENVFALLFTREYVDDDDDEIVSAMILTLREYLGDLAVWIETEELFWQCVTSTVVIIADEYVHAMLRSADSISSEVDTVRLAKMVDDDVDALNNYFAEPQLKFCAILWNIKRKYLRAIASALRCEEAEEFATHAQVLRGNQRYGKKLVAFVERQRKKYTVEVVASTIKKGQTARRRKNMMGVPKQ